MDEVSALRTHSSLLARLGQNPTDQSAWSEFADRYGPRINAWCRAWGLQEADAQDVSQAVLVQLAAKMRSFVYDPSRSFRAWLKTLAHHAWSDFVTDRAKAMPGRPPDSLSSFPARDDLEARLQEAFDLELLAIATERVRSRVAPNTWEAFRLTAMEGLSGAEVAQKLNMQVAAVFKAKSNVQKMLQETVVELDGGK
jgi:RNA polymerase sigma factor (sigma-70 family)